MVAKKVRPFQKQAARGVRWLDRHQPGWADRINLDRLDVGHYLKCVLGQLFRNYWTALRRFSLKNFGRALGFNVDAPADTWELQQEWVRRIKARRVKKGRKQ